MAGLSHVNLPGRADLLVTQLHLRMHSAIVFTVVILVLLTVGGLAIGSRSPGARRPRWTGSPWRPAH